MTLPVGDDGFSINNLAFSINDETAKQITAKAIREVNADVLALQEIDNLKVLDRFVSRYLGGMKYKHRILIDAFDPRNIDVGLISRYPITRVKTYRDERNSRNTASLFSRDCLEVDINVNGKTLTVYVNHLKSMIRTREETYPRRKEQADRIAEIIEERWGSSGYKGNYAVVGDFNDYIDEKTSLKKLLDHPGLVDVGERLDPGERWTHFWNKRREYRQLDFMFLSPELADKNSNPPEIMRKGLPHRATKYEGERFKFVGEDNPKASDHCPMYIDLDLV